MLLAPFVKRSVRKLEEQYENDPDSLPEEVRASMYFTRLDDKAYEELKAGDLKRAETLAAELVKVSREFEGHWNYGNALHHGNTVLGLVAIKRGDIDNAVEYLSKSGNTPGSPQLDSHGPSFCLAIELLKHHRESEVLSYLSQIEKFWDFGYKHLPKWRADIEQGHVPANWKCLDY